MVEQHAHRDVGRGREAADDPGRQHFRKPGVEGQPAALGQLQHHDRHERLRDAPGPEPISAAHRDIRRHAAEAGDAGPAAEPRAAYVQDRPRSGRARIAQRGAQSPLQLTSELRVEARAGPSRERRGMSRSARRPAQPGGGHGAGGGHQQRLAVDPVARRPVSNGSELDVRHTFSFPRGEAPRGFLSATEEVRQGDPRRSLSAVPLPPGRPAGGTSRLLLLARVAVVPDYLSTRLRTTPMMTKLGTVCVMSPIHVLWKRRVG